MMKILIVDDSTVNNILLENLFESHGYDCYSVLESDSVIDTINTYKPDIILLDIMMPGLTGFDILKLMNKHSIKIPTIILTAYKNSDYKKQAKELGAVEYFSKPFDQEELLKTIKEVTSK